jgi:hypothetical protein
LKVQAKKRASRQKGTLARKISESWTVASSCWASARGMAIRPMATSRTPWTIASPLAVDAMSRCAHVRLAA